MPKLTGKRLASARKNIKKAQKALRAKLNKRPKRRKSNPRKTNKRRKSNPGVAKKKGGRRRSNVGAMIKKGLIGGAGGVVVELILTRLGARSLATDAGYITASQIGNKAGVIGNAVIRQGIQRFAGNLGFLNGGGQQGGGGNGFA